MNSSWPRTAHRTHISGLDAHQQNRREANPNDELRVARAIFGALALSLVLWLVLAGLAFWVVDLLAQ